MTLTGQVAPLSWCTIARITSGGRSLSRLVLPFGLANVASLPNCVTEATSTRGTPAPLSRALASTPTLMPPTSLPGTRYGT